MKNLIIILVISFLFSCSKENYNINDVSKVKFNIDKYINICNEYDSLIVLHKVWIKLPKSMQNWFSLDSTLASYYRKIDTTNSVNLNLELLKVYDDSLNIPNDLNKIYKNIAGSAITLLSYKSELVSYFKEHQNYFISEFQNSYNDYKTYLKEYENYKPILDSILREK